MVPWWQEQAERATLLGMRMTFGDEATAEILFENEDASSRESMEFAKRHPNTMASLIDAKFKEDEDT